MSQLIETANLTGKVLAEMSIDQRHWLYNGFDCTVTSEVLDKTEPQLDEYSQLIYNFERGLQAPALDMMLRGIRVDGEARDKLTTKLRAQSKRIQAHAFRMGELFGFTELNVRSHIQMKKLLYEVLGLPEQHEFTRGERRVSTNRRSLENLEDYTRAKPFVQVAFALRDITQQLSVLQADIRNGRMYTSLNIGKETGRWSSSGSVFNDGRSMQNIMHSLRTIFIPDPGMRMAYVDLKQAESNSVAHLADDPAYIEAHLSGNVHKYVCKLVWPHVKDAKEEMAYRHFSYYDLGKRGGHASNYFAKPPTIAKHLKIPLDLAVDFQRKLFKAFPKVRQWQYDTISTVQRTSTLITPLGRRRTFFGRVDDETTLREAIAHVPQSLVADILNVGLYRVWKELQGLGVQLLLPVHDALLIQYPEAAEPAVFKAMTKLMMVPVSIGSRTMRIESDFASGYNWTEFNDNPEKGEINLAGLVEWGSNDREKQRRPDTAAALLARRVH